MTPPRFLADHNFNEHIIVGVLRSAPQLVFLRVREVGLAEQPDPMIIAYAAGQGLLLVSHDVNTMPAAAYARMADGHLMSGLLLVPQVASIGAVIEDLLLVWSASDASEWENQVVFLPFDVR
jgi:hypothetical protein